MQKLVFRLVEVHELNHEAGELVFLFYVNVNKHSKVRKLYDNVIHSFHDEFFKDDEPFPGRDHIEVRFETELKEAGYHGLPMSYSDFKDVLFQIVLIVHE